MSQELPPFNDTLREGVVGLVESISPEGVPVGGVLGYIIGMFWPTEDHSGETWNSIKKYAEAMVDKKVDAARVEALSLRLDGLKNVARDYGQTSMGSPQKGQHLTSLLDELTLFEGDFWDERSPEQMFPLFSSFGTLWIFAKAEQALCFDKVYGVADPDSDKHMRQLRDNIVKYTAGAQAMFDRLYSWRFSLLEISMHWTGSWRNFKQWGFIDHYDGYTVGGESGRATTREEAEGFAAQRAAEINGNFVESLQAILVTAQLWAYADPSVPRRPKEYEVTGQGAIGALGGSEFMDHPASVTSRVSRVRVRHGDVVDCLEMFYDGHSAGSHGNPEGGDLSELELGSDETVVEVSGRCGEFVDQLQFTTSKGRTVGGGGGGGQPFSTKGHSSWHDVSLFAMGGRNDDRRLIAVNPLWRHQTQMPRFIASYKRAGRALTSNANIQLKTQDGRYLSELHEDYDKSAASNEYFPKIGSHPATLQLQLPGQADGDLYDHAQVYVWTSEPIAKAYPYLGKFGADDVYYYSLLHDRRQVWVLLKMIPSEGPVLFGEKVYLRNLDDDWYLFPAGGDYLATRSEPFEWEAVPVA